MTHRFARPRRGALAETAPSAQFFRQLSDLVPQMLWTARPDGSIEYVNARVVEYHGRKVDQLQGWGWRSTVHADDWDRCAALWTKALKKGHPYEVECRLRRHDGRYFWHVVAAMPRRENGRIVRWFGSSTEIENQKRAERLLEKARHALGSLVESRADQPIGLGDDVGRPVDVADRAHDQERFRAFLDSMPAIAWIKDSSFRYVWVSASYARMHGRSSAEFAGRDDFEVWPEALARLYRKDDELTLRANGPLRFFEQSPFADGSTARWQVVKFPMPDASGILGVAGVAFEIADAHIHAPEEAGPDSPNPIERLSGRERQVMQLIVDGHTSADVGERLRLSPKSVDTYRSRLMAKLGIEDLPSLVKFALRHGLTAKR
jgi:PAS domain S-box-containing protein